MWDPRSRKSKTYERGGDRQAGMLFMVRHAFMSKGPGPTMLDRLLQLIFTKGVDLSTFQAACVAAQHLAGAPDGCVALLRYPSFLRNCQDLLQTLIKKNDAQRQAALLEVLVNITSHQQGVSKLLKSNGAPGLVDLVVVVASGTNVAAINAALFLLRNLAFNPENNSHFMADKRTLQVLLDALGEVRENPKGALYAASALWALTYGGERVKAHIRNAPNAIAVMKQAEAHCMQVHLATRRSGIIGKRADEYPYSEAEVEDLQEAGRSLAALLDTMDVPPSNMTSSSGHSTPAGLATPHRLALSSSVATWQQGGALQSNQSVLDPNLHTSQSAARNNALLSTQSAARNNALHSTQSTQVVDPFLF